jgi:hypothetical protein
VCVCDQKENTKAPAARSLSPWVLVFYPFTMLSRPLASLKLLQYALSANHP